MSHYIANPLLVNDYKFDLRIYVGITSINPGMNAASAFARNLDNVMRPFGGGRPPPGGGGQGPPPFRRSEVCFSCNRDGSHRWRACPLYPEMANAVSLNSSHCGSCGGRHHGPCRSHQ